MKDIYTVNKDVFAKGKSNVEDEKLLKEKKFVSGIADWNKRSRFKMMYTRKHKSKVDNRKEIKKVARNKKRDRQKKKIEN